MKNKYIFFLLILKFNKTFNTENINLNLKISNDSKPKIEQGLIKQQVINFTFENESIDEENIEKIKKFIYKYQLESKIFFITFLYFLIGNILNKKAEYILNKKYYKKIKKINLNDLENLKNEDKNEIYNFLKNKFKKIKKLKNFLIKTENYFNNNIIKRIFTFIPLIFKESNTLRKNKNLLNKKIKILLSLISNIS